MPTPPTPLFCNVYANKGLAGARGCKCMQINVLAELRSSESKLRRGLKLFKIARPHANGFIPSSEGSALFFRFYLLLACFSFLFFPQIFSLRLSELCVARFSVFFRPQKVHYNALFPKIRPQHAL